MTTRNTSIALLAALAVTVGAGCSKTAPEQVDSGQLSTQEPNDATRTALVTQAEAAYDTAMKKADGDRNFAISRCTKLANKESMPCMNQADEEFAAARDRAKAELDAVRM